MSIERSNDLDIYISGLQRFQEHFDEDGLDYRVVGGLSTRLYIGDLGGLNNLDQPADIDLLAPRICYYNLSRKFLENTSVGKDGVKYDLSISRYIDFGHKMSIPF